MRRLKRTLLKTRDKATSHLLKRMDGVDIELVELKKGIHRLAEGQTQIGKYDSVGLMQLSESEIATKIFNDLIMYLDPRDIAVVPHIVFERIWEREITYAWLSVLNKSNATVIDVGANFGYYGMLAAQRLDKKKGKVVFFEPNPELLYYIHKTLSVNWLNENTVVENMGLDEKSGTTQLYLLEDYIGSSSMHSAKQLSSYLDNHMTLKEKKVFDVPTITLDEYCKTNKIKQVDFIKMDIEGYEEAAYAGMKQVVRNSPELVLFLEFTHAGYKDPEGFYAQLLEDFEYVYTIDADGSLRVPEDSSYGKLVATTEVLIFIVLSKYNLL